MYLAGGDVVAASEAAGALRDIAATLDVPYARANSLHADGQVQVPQHDLPAAFDSLRRAWRPWRDLGTRARPPARAPRPVACRAAGDDEGADMELDAARSAFSSLGAGPDLASVEHASLPEAGGAPAGLSLREVEVLVLVAAGHTHREIAAMTIVSEHAVARHVQNILANVGANTRTAAAAVAHRHGLV